MARNLLMIVVVLYSKYSLDVSLPIVKSFNCSRPAFPITVNDSYSDSPSYFILHVQVFSLVSLFRSFSGLHHRQFLEKRGDNQSKARYNPLRLAESARGATATESGITINTAVVEAQYKIALARPNLASLGQNHPIAPKRDMMSPAVAPLPVM